MEQRLIYFIAVLLIIAGVLALCNLTGARKEQKENRGEHFFVHAPLGFCLYGIVPLLILAGLMALFLFLGRAAEIPGWGLVVVSVFLVVPNIILALQPVSTFNRILVSGEKITVRTLFSRKTYDLSQIRFCALAGDSVRVYVKGKEEEAFSFEKQDSGYADFLTTLSNAGVPIRAMAVL